MPTRRTFLKRSWQGATGVSLAAMGLYCNAEDEKKGQPLEVIDCHTHFYDPTRPEGIPWPRKGSPLYRQVLPKHLRALPHAQKVTGTVIVEASSRLEDNQWLLDIAEDDPFVVGIVGHLKPGQKEFAGHVRRFSRSKLFRGIRVGQGLVEGLLESDNLADFKLLQEHDLELDVNGGPTMPAVVGRLAERLPELRIVVNHIGNVRIDKNPPPADWAKAIQASAGHENVFCKASALVEGASRGGGKAPTDVSFYRPYLDVVSDAFGDDRLIYGSDWPVSERAADYKTQQQIVLDYVKDRGAETLRKFFSINSKKAYKWVEREGRLT